MNRKLYFFVLIVFLLSACGTGNIEGEGIETLVVKNGEEEAIYTVADLQKIGEVEEEFLGETYLGVPLRDLLTSSGIELDTIKSVKAVAGDGYSVLYDNTLFLRTDVLVAYAKLGESLSPDDGTFRMVLPGEEGKLNLRMLVEIAVETQ